MNTSSNWAARVRALLGRTQATLPAEPDGGLALPRNKPGLLPVTTPIVELPLPDQLVLPLLDYAKQVLSAEVAVGTRVKPGDRLAQGIIATANGVISTIEPRSVIHPSQCKVPSIVIDVDHCAQENLQTLPPLPEPSIERLEQACISGLGGAGFSTARKLSIGNITEGQVHTLLVNAVECEPLISCDEALMRSDALSVAEAIYSMVQLTQCKRCVVAIEEDKTEAAAQLSQALHDCQTGTSGAVNIEFTLLSAIYPSGAEKVLVQRITGKTLASGERALDRGIVCLNIATVFAAWQAKAGYPLLSRIITVAGSNAAQVVNVRVRIGTSVEHILRQTNNGRQLAQSRVRVGGPLSGFDLSDHSVPITATTNCIAIEPAITIPEAIACIRCGQCSDVCPVSLVPQQLFWYANGDDLTGAIRFGLDNCIECGCCDVVCPSSIQLTSTFRYARAAWREKQQQALDAELARTRYEKRETRVMAREQEAQRLRELKKSQLASTDDAIAGALARARARKKKQ